MKKNPLIQLEALGQSIWLDFISRQTINTGQLKKWIEGDGVSGITSNPTIFDKAISSSQDYDVQIASLARSGKNAQQIFTALAITDIQQAADLFRPTFDRLGGQDGYVSLEVSPHLAHNTQATLVEARQLWQAVDRPNLMIKVPGTRAGLPAIEQLLSEGINVNITLLFGLPRYREVTEAFLSGLKKRLSQNQPVDHVASVASFFLSRIDVLLDPRLEELIRLGGSNYKIATRIQGEVAIASAQRAYEIFQEVNSGPLFKRLAKRGAHPQRVLWASTGTKNPNYSDVKYVEALIGPETIDTLPVETLDAYRDHGEPALRLAGQAEQAHQVFRDLDGLDIDIHKVTRQLEEEGVEKFIKSYDQLMDTIKDKMAKFQGDKTA